MQYLVITSDVPNVNWDEQAEILKAESRRVYALWRGSVIRQIWFSEAGDAVLILECLSKEEAARVVESLPLVKGGLLRYTLAQLEPYTGFDRVLQP